MLHKGGVRMYVRQSNANLSVYPTELHTCDLERDLFQLATSSERCACTVPRYRHRSMASRLLAWMTSATEKGLLEVSITSLSIGRRYRYSFQPRNPTSSGLVCFRSKPFAAHAKF